MRKVLTMLVTTMGSMKMHVLSVLTLALLVTTCTEDPQAPPEASQSELLPPTSPSNVLQAIEELYSARDMNPEERSREFASLLAPPNHPKLPSFTFRYGLCDIECPWDGWDYDGEVQAHQRMFERQTAGDFYSITVHTNPVDEFDDVIRQEWKVIYSSSPQLRVVLNPEDVTEFSTGEHFFTFAPADGRWYLVEWKEYLSPAMWGSFKARFLRGE